MWSLLIHVQHTGHDILFTKSLVQPSEVGLSPLVQPTFIQYLHHLLVRPRQNDSDSLALVLRHLA